MNLICVKCRLNEMPHRSTARVNGVVVERHDRHSYRLPELAGYPVLRDTAARMIARRSAPSLSLNKVGQAAL